MRARLSKIPLLRYVPVLNSKSYFARVKSSRTHKILICPLDWGLGHAARMVPIIQELLDHHYEVLLGTSGNQKDFFLGEFPSVPQVDALSYQIQYPRIGWLMPVWLCIEIPRLLRLRKKEHHWTEAICKEHQVDFIISDNRFGCFSQIIPSVYITHQIRIALPRLLQWAEPMTQWAHRLIQKSFLETWIPDSDSPQSLGGRLSHSGIKKGFHFFIGPQTRFKEKAEKENPEKIWDWLVLISGPEPQRSLFEEKAMAALSHMNAGKVLLVRGRPGQTETPKAPAHFVIYNHLPSPELRNAILSSRMILCRSGYSTLMDLQALYAKAILVPTPGQTEQIALAEDLHQKGFCTHLPQNELSFDNLNIAKNQCTGFHSDSSSTQSILPHIERLLLRDKKHV